MRSIDDIYILFGLAWLIVGLAFGIWMGINEQFQFISVHAHMNLVGFVISVAFGLILRAYPEIKTSRLAMPQFIIWQIGTAILIAGKAVVAQTGDPRLVAGGVVCRAGRRDPVCDCLCHAARPASRGAAAQRTTVSRSAARVTAV
jgi:hypothetical protein